MAQATHIPHEEDPRDPRFRAAPADAHEDGAGNRAPQPELFESQRRGHEVRDAHLKPIILFLVIMFAAIAVIQFGLKYLLRHETARNSRADDPVNLWTANKPVPPEPRLQPSPAHPEVPYVDMMKLSAHWKELLTTEGPSEAGPGFSRIPIDRAIDQAVEQGLPKPPATQPATTPPGGAR